jgi:diguanylate cyclase (GGDEF)-like protein
VTLGAIGLLGYLIAERELTQRQLEAYGSIQRTDVQSIEEAAARGGSRGVPGSRQQRMLAVREVQEALRAVAIRPNVIDAEVTDPRGIVIAARSRLALGRDRSGDPEVVAAFDRGDGYREKIEHGFRFVNPVSIGPRRLALETIYDDHTLHDRIGAIRRALIVTSVLTLLLGALVFHFMGGRALIRSHRFALQRATLDGLTGLFNQRAFADDLERIVRTSEEMGEPLCLALIALDRFSEVNDREGREAGDALLLRVAGNLQRQRPADRIYRIAEDQFAVLMAQAGAEESRILVARLAALLRADGIEASIGASTLASEIPPDVLRSEATAALAESKRRGGNMYSHFDDLRDKVDVTSAQQLDAVRQMIDEAGVTTSFQPIWNLAERRLLGVEALTRPDAKYSLPGPAEAFDIAEQIGQVRSLDLVCSRSALRTAAAMLPADALLFVNVAPLTLDIAPPEERWLFEEAARAGIPPERIVVEVTERFGARTAGVTEHLRALRADGFKIALDDVGTGNAGLEMLGQIRADFVKIDRSIISAAPEDDSARAVLMAIATYSFQTGSFVIAEGIENDGILAFLEDLDTRAMRAALVIQGGQGYGLGRPSPEMPVETPWPGPS